MIDQTLTTPPTAPSSNDIPTFRERFDAFIAWLVIFVSQLITVISQINSTASTINSKESSAANSADTATAQAVIATTKAGEASASAASALSSKEAAEAIFDSFDDKYLGAKSTEPTVDNDGNPLVTGALFFKTTSPKGIYVYDAELSVWSIFSYVPTSHGTLSGRSDVDAHPMDAITGLIAALADKQALLVSGTNIKTINSTSPLGSGNIDVSTPDATDTVKGKVELATNAEVQAGMDTTRVVTPAGMKAGLNASGTAPIYACRAWMDFNGTGTVDIRGDGNFSSVTDGGVGIYTANLTTAMPNVNYATVTSCGNYVEGSSWSTTCEITSQTTAAIGLRLTYNGGSGAVYDNARVTLAIFG